MLILFNHDHEWNVCTINRKCPFSSSLTSPYFNEFFTWKRSFSSAFGHIWSLISKSWFFRTIRIQQMYSFMNPFVLVINCELSTRKVKFFKKLTGIEMDIENSCSTKTWITKNCTWLSNFCGKRCGFAILGLIVTSISEMFSLNLNDLENNHRECYYLLTDNVPCKSSQSPIRVWAVGFIIFTRSFPSFVPWKHRKYNFSVLNIIGN